MNDLKIFSGRANPDLARKISEYLGIALGKISIGNFPDGEISCKIDEDVRGRDVFIVQPTCPPVNENLMELLIMIDSFLRASAYRITAVLPYFGYARQDRKDAGRVPITAKLVANMIARAGTDRVLAMDLHAAQLQGFFDVPVDHLYAAPVLNQHFNAQGFKREDLVVASADEGGIKRAFGHGTRLGAPLAVVDKRRISADTTRQENIIGASVKDKIVLMFDDMISTASSIAGAAKVLKENGARADPRRRHARRPRRPGHRTAEQRRHRHRRCHRHDSPDARADAAENQTAFRGRPCWARPSKTSTATNR